MKKDKKKRNVVVSGNNSRVTTNTMKVTYEKTFMPMNKMQKRGDKSIYT